ncbi:hypothetical protein ACLBYG_22295 [Methylobacterium sp. D53M]
MLRTLLASRWLRGLLPLGFAMALLSLVIDASMRSARADIIGWQIEARACQGPARCAAFPPSPALWRNRYACQVRAENLERGAADMPPDALGLPKGRFSVSVRCRPVEGLPSA